MGLCLSCLRNPELEDEEFNERSSLLHGGFYTDEHLQEELIKKQQRQQELNNLVSELSDNLIDVSSFLLAGPSLNTHTLNGTNHPNYGVNGNNSAPGTPNLSMSEKQYPNYVSAIDKDKILQEVKELDPAIKEKCKITNNENLYLKF